ncbi:hypothetical protein LX36DRAFT_127046 [Colletotrichum falcatum]|nr:hypothetical protein LX36DRAFT_127046 [Colletotrichum falcatum]
MGIITLVRMLSVSHAVHPSCSGWSGCGHRGTFQGHLSMLVSLHKAACEPLGIQIRDIRGVVEPRDEDLPLHFGQWGQLLDFAVDYSCMYGGTYCTKTLRHE